jgi:hypothetical protein
MYQVRVAMRDEESGQLGSANQFLETPDLAKGAWRCHPFCWPKTPAGRRNRALRSPKTALQVRTRIFRGGQQVYEGQPMAPDVRGQADQKRLVAGGNMVLAKNIAPGYYVLHVIVEDKLAPAKRQTSAQSMDSRCANSYGTGGARRHECRRGRHTSSRATRATF